MTTLFGRQPTGSMQWGVPRAAIDALAEAGVLGLPVAQPAGGGGGLADAVVVVRSLAEACGSTAMVVLMDYAATSVLNEFGPEKVREAIGSGRHLSTLAFSEAVSRSHFWAPLGTATAAGSMVRLDAGKSWITAAGEADSYVWHYTSTKLSKHSAGVFAHLAELSNVPCRRHQ